MPTIKKKNLLKHAIKFVCESLRHILFALMWFNGLERREKNANENVKETFWGLGLKGAFCFTSLKLFHSHEIPKNYPADTKLGRKAEK